MTKIVIYLRVPCAYCVNAKRLLENKGLSFEEIDLTDNPTELDSIKTRLGWKTVPIIMINDKLIGGYSDLKALDEAGGLDANN